MYRCMGFREIFGGLFAGPKSPEMPAQPAVNQEPTPEEMPPMEMPGDPDVEAVEQGSEQPQM